MVKNLRNRPKEFHVNKCKGNKYTHFYYSILAPPHPSIQEILFFLESRIKYACVEDNGKLNLNLLCHFNILPLDLTGRFTESCLRSTADLLNK